MPEKETPVLKAQFSINEDGSFFLEIDGNDFATYEVTRDQALKLARAFARASLIYYAGCDQIYSTTPEMESYNGKE